MPIVKAAEIHYIKLNPKRPNANFNKDNPTWELQIRTRDKAVKRQWEEMKLSVKLIEVDPKPAKGNPGDKDYKPEVKEDTYYRVNLKKRSKKKDGSPNQPVEVVDGKMNPIDPNSIGHGSIANIRIFQYEYKNKGKEGIASVLMAVQVTKLIKYEAKARDDEFEEEDTEIVDPPESGEPEEAF